MSKDVTSAFSAAADSASVAAELLSGLDQGSPLVVVFFAHISLDGREIGDALRARFPGASAISGALLVFIVAVLASQSNFEGIGQAPLYLLCGLTILAIHGGLLVLAARVFHFDLHLCGIASLANIGGVASAPILAASYSRALVPVGILLALLGYVIGTGLGIVMASVLSTLAPT